MGPFVQPTLLENWVTGVFEFGAHHPYIYSLLKVVYWTILTLIV